MWRPRSQSLAGELTKSASESEEAVAAKTEEMKEALLEMKELLQKTKTELSDKIHEENVTCYRNIQTLFDDFGEKVDKVENLDSGVKSIKSYVKCLSWFSIREFYRADRIYPVSAGCVFLMNKYIKKSLELLKGFLLCKK